MTLLAVLLLSAFGALTAQTPEGKSAARAAMERGDSATAERLFRAASLASPDDAEALVGWAHALREQERAPEAYARLRSAVDRWLRSDQLEPAAAALGFLAEEIPSDAATQSRLGSVLVRLRRFTAAQMPLERALASGADLRATLLLGSVVWENGDAGRAAELFRAVGESTGPMAAAGWTQLGRLELWRSRPSEALAALEQARRRGDDGLELKMEQARALAQLSESEPSPESTQRALAAYKALTLRVPESPQLRYRYARLLARAGQAEDARQEMSRYRALDRASREATRSAGVTSAKTAAAREHLAMGEPELALEALRGAGAAAVELRSLALLQLGRYGEARKALEEALQVDPGRTELRALLARAVAQR